MKRTFTKIIGIAFICLLMALAISGGRNPEAMAAETIKIGQLATWSGPLSFLGRAWYPPLKFAVDEQNAKGGLLGKKIEIIKADDEFKPDVAARKAEQLILEKKVNFICSSVGTHIGIALNKVATKYKTITIHPDLHVDILQGKEFSRYAFHTAVGSHPFNSALVRLMATKPYRKFYIICQDFVGGHDLAKGFKEQVKIHIPDAQIVGEDYHPLNTMEFGPYIEKVIASKADAIYSPNWGMDYTNLVRQARAMGLKAPFPFAMPFGGLQWDLYGLKEDALGIHAASNYTMRVDTPENNAMIAKYHEQHKNDEEMATRWPDTVIGQAICGWQMVLAAVEKAGSLDPEEIIEAFEGFRYKTPVGWWTMRKCDHQVLSPMFGIVITADPNPYWDFPWHGPDIVTFDAMETAIPPTSDYNPRCP